MHDHNPLEQVWDLLEGGCVCKSALKTTNLELIGFSCVLVSTGAAVIRVVPGQEQPGLWTLFVRHPAEVGDDPLLVGSVRMRVSTLLEIEDTTSCCKFTYYQWFRKPGFTGKHSFIWIQQEKKAKLNAIPPRSVESIKNKSRKKCTYWY